MLSIVAFNGKGMKPSNLKAFSLTSALILGFGGGMFSTLALPQPSSAETLGHRVAQVAALSGAFVGDAHPTKGTARIVTENGKRFLVFDTAFKTDAGPDLFVLLHKSVKPKTYRNRDYISLGRLKKTNGTQRYAIPDSVNLADFQSAVVWCRRFNVTFGYAQFGR